jgi:hypothetical protein
MRLTLPLAVLLIKSAAAGDIVVVAPPSLSAPYAEALAGICEALGSCPPVMTNADISSLPADARSVIALGGKAARLPYPPVVRLVTLLTPGYSVRRQGSISRVKMTYSPGDFVKRLAALKPGVRSISLLWSDRESQSYALGVGRESLSQGIIAQAVRCSDASDLPSLLRSLPPRDAVWISPDPSLVTPLAFDAAREYAHSLGAIFFAPAPGLASRGAQAGLAPTFRAAGRRAAQAAKQTPSDAPVDEDVYPEDATDFSASALAVSSKTSSETP